LISIFRSVCEFSPKPNTFSRCQKNFSESFNSSLEEKISPQEFQRKFPNPFRHLNEKILIFDDKNHKQTDEIKASSSFFFSSLVIIKINSIFIFSSREKGKERKDVAHTIKQQSIFTQASSKRVNKNRK
jgi:hypothetical protein